MITYNYRGIHQQQVTEAPMPQSPGDGATDRDCPNCIWHCDNGCTVWDCDFISRAEAKKRLYLNRKESDPK